MFKSGKVAKCSILNTFNLVVFKPSVGVIITHVPFTLVPKQTASLHSN